ncbi:hypothetical protein GF376_04195, partial [Candidatus Peregrinibacteria bacterium]|nr:hypothetical protein [Candidatus Peregrinibacteria bacterium]
MKKLILFLAIFLTACQSSPSLTATVESDFSSSKFVEYSEEIPGANANQVYYLKNESIFGLILSLTIKDILSENHVKAINIPQIQELYLIENNLGTDDFPNYETYLMLVYENDSQATETYRKLQPLLSGANTTSSLRDDTISIKVNKKDQTIQADQAKLAGKFANNSFFNGTDLKYSDTVLYSAAFKKTQKDLNRSFWDIFVRTQAELSNPEFDKNVAEIEKLQEASAVNSQENLYFARQAEGKIKIVYT